MCEDGGAYEAAFTGLLLRPTQNGLREELSMVDLMHKGRSHCRHGWTLILRPKHVQVLSGVRALAKYIGHIQSLTSSHLRRAIDTGNKVSKNRSPPELPFPAILKSSDRWV